LSGDEKMMYQEKFNRDRKEYIKKLQKYKLEHPEENIKIPKIKNEKKKSSI
jgi:hypothetical protein